MEIGKWFRRIMALQLPGLTGEHFPGWPARITANKKRNSTKPNMGMVLFSNSYEVLVELMPECFLKSERQIQYFQGTEYRRLTRSGHSAQSGQLGSVHHRKSLEGYEQ